MIITIVMTHENTRLFCCYEPINTIMSHVLFALFTCLVLCNAYIRQIYCDIVRLSLFFNENITLVSGVGSLAHAHYSSCSGKNGRAVGKAIRVGPTAADCLESSNAT